MEGVMERRIVKPWVKATDDITIKSKIQTITGKSEIAGIDTLVKYFKTLYNGERYYTRIVESKEYSNPQDRRKDADQTSMHLYLEEHLDDLSKICDYRLREHYGEDYTDDFVAVPDGYRVADVPEGFPTAKRRTTTAYPISDEEMKARYFKHPLIPVMREGNVIKFMGLDSQSKKPVLFAMSIDNDKSTNCQNILLVLEAHGEEEGIINLDRVTCNPPTIHEDFARDEHGKILVDKFGVAKTVKVYPTYTSNHNFCMQDRLTDPNGYSARVDVLDEGLVIENNKAFRKEITQDGKEELYPATFDDALSIFMNKHNMIYCQTARYNKGTNHGACQDVDTLLSMHFDDMILADESTPFTLDSYKELGAFALEIAHENIKNLQTDDQNIDLESPANKKVLAQIQEQGQEAVSFNISASNAKEQI